MAWEKRNKQTYYYRRSRVHGRIVSEYLGRGPVAQAVAEHDERQNAQAAQEKEQERALLQEYDRLAQLVDEFGADVKMLVSAHLLLNGYHCHHGEWRKRRKPKTPALPPPGQVQEEI